VHFFKKKVARHSHSTWTGNDENDSGIRARSVEKIVRDVLRTTHPRAGQGRRARAVARVDSKHRVASQLQAHEREKKKKKIKSTHK
jgi:hypothetical protein